MAVQKDFFKYNPETDGNLTFNIDKALNENWEKVNEGLREVGEAAGKIKGITVNGEEQDVDENGNVTITTPEIKTSTAEIITSGWALDSGSGLYKLTIANEAVTANSIVNVNLDLASLEVATDCGLKAVTESYDGGFYIYADAAPASAMTGTIVIQKGV